MSSEPQPARLSRLNDDVFLNICDAVNEQTPAKDGKGQRDLQSLKALSQCNRRFRSILATDIFRSVCIFRPESWTKAQELLDSIRRCDDVKHYTKSFTINFLDRQLDFTDMPTTFMHDLVDLLAGMAKLKDLAFGLTQQQRAQSLQAALESKDVSFPTVRTLYSNADTHFLIPRCPNLESITSGRAQQIVPPRINEPQIVLLDACKSSPHLQHFELRSSWPRWMLEQVLATMPRLTSLGMPGARYRDKLAGLVFTLSKFERLKTLVIASAADLGLGFCPPRCGNVYMGPNGAAVRKQVQEGRAEADARAAGMCFEACKALEVLWIGDQTRATVTRDAEGGVGAVEIVNGLRRAKSRLD